VIPHGTLQVAGELLVIYTHLTCQKVAQYM
jgi:hypothetical protein